MKGHATDERASGYLQALRVKTGLVVLTKIDLLDRELLELVEEEVTGIVEDTFLKDAPILPVSSVTGEGIPQLLSALDLLSQEIRERSSGGYSVCRSTVCLR